MDFKSWLVKQVGRQQAEYILGERSTADAIFAVGPFEVFIYFVMPTLICVLSWVIVRYHTRERLEQTHSILAEIVRHKRGEIYDRKFIQEEPDMPQDVSILMGEIQ